MWLFLQLDVFCSHLVSVFQLCQNLDGKLEIMVLYFDGREDKIVGPELAFPKHRVANSNFPVNDIQNQWFK